TVDTMAQLEYRDADELPATLRRKVFVDREEQRWRVMALVIRRHPVSDKEISRTAFLRRVDSSGGREWEIALDTLYETAEVDR
ncbi:hypothetical protein ACIGW7_39795, partial [Streptomyces sp. NPDC053253]|uniref:hypothetical protein n=1 Tax=Streptomyces sp. NPDC053253 TaxID=3365699 RepID=UPI0037D978AB